MSDRIVSVSIGDLKNSIIEAGLGIEEQILKRFTVDKKQQIADEYVARVSDYVPEDTGEMVESAIDNTEVYSSSQKIKITWVRTKDDFDVAEAQYTNPSYTHSKPKATDHWNEAFIQSSDYDAFLVAIAEIMRKK